MTKKKPNPYDIYSLSSMRKRRRKSSEFDLYPDFNKRMIAATLDSVVLMFLTPVFDWLAPIDRSGLSTIAMAARDQENPPPVSSLTMQLLQDHAFVRSWLENFSLQCLAFLIYSAICWYFWSATPGKMIMGMKIVQAKTHKPINIVNIALRLAGYVISMTCLMAGILWIGTNKRHRGWHDYLAYTEVINTPYPWNKKKHQHPATPPAPVSPQPEEIKTDETPAD
jgi:uncharacterized RDD family membrane protein YckC